MSENPIESEPGLPERRPRNNRVYGYQAWLGVILYGLAGFAAFLAVSVSLWMILYFIRSPTAFFDGPVFFQGPLVIVILVGVAFACKNKAHELRHRQIRSRLPDTLPDFPDSN